MSLRNDYIVQIAEMSNGASTRDVEKGLKPATLTLADANKYGFDTIEEYKEAIIEYVYG